jgi:flagellar basal-body rod modification protein FlgD
MSTVSSATAVAATSQANSSSISEAAMGKEDFLTLLVAQLQNQDPLNPSDPTEFTAQLAQFSSLEQLFTINKSISEMVEMQGQNSSAYALNMIGQNAVVVGNEFELNGESTQLGFELDSAAAGATLYVMDENGVTVKTFEETALSAGNHFIEWDGTNDAGVTVASGQYRLVATANYGNGSELPANTLVVSEVRGVDLDSENPRIITNQGNYDLNEVKSVRSL